MTINDPFGRSPFHDDWGVAPLPREDEADRLPPMTVCIAAYCEGSKSVVVAADRGVVYRRKALMPNGSDPKLLAIASHVVMAASGAPTNADFVAKFNHEALSKLGTGEVVEHAQGVVGGLRSLEVNEIVRRETSGVYPSAPALLAAFKDNQGNKVLLDVYSKVVNHRLATAFFVAGVGPSGAGLWVSDEFANMHRRDCPGFVAIGTGEDYAMLTLFARAPCIKNMPVEQAVYHVYEAKKMAERTPGVAFGGDTDMVVIHPASGVRFLSREAIDRLEEVRKKKQPPGLDGDDMEVIRGALHDKPS